MNARVRAYSCAHGGVRLSATHSSRALGWASSIKFETVRHLLACCSAERATSFINTSSPAIQQSSNPVASRQPPPQSWPRQRLRAIRGSSFPRALAGPRVLLASRQEWAGSAEHVAHCGRRPPTLVSTNPAPFGIFRQARALVRGYTLRGGSTSLEHGSTLIPHRRTRAAEPRCPEQGATSLAGCGSPRPRIAQVSHIRLIPPASEDDV